MCYTYVEISLKPISVRQCGKPVINIMNILNPKTISEVAACLAVCPMAVHEHSAWCCYGNFEDDTRALFNMGYDIVHKVEGLAVFFSHEISEHRIELIGVDREAHEAWAVKTKAEFTKLNESFEQSALFKPTGEFYNIPELKARLFRHRESGAVVQIVWRKKQVYKDLF